MDEIISSDEQCALEKTKLSTLEFMSIKELTLHAFKSKLKISQELNVDLLNDILLNIDFIRKHEWALKESK